MSPSETASHTAAPSGTSGVVGTTVAAVVNTVTGPLSPSELGIVAIHESLLSVLPGAQYAYDIEIDRAEIFDVLAAKLEAFRAAGGGTLVDATGMFHGRDLRLYEALSRATGVHIIASTGMGPEEQLGGYFLTPQTNPPTPWPAERFAELFTAEATEGMVVPRVERRGLAGLIVTAITRDGATPTDESLLRGAARAAAATGVPLSFRCGGDALAELQIALDEGLPASRIIVAGADRADLVDAGRSEQLDRADVAGVDRADLVRLGLPLALAERGANLAFDHVGWNDSSEYLNDEERIRLLDGLITAGYGDRVLLSSSAIGVAKGLASRELPYEQVLSVFAPRVVAASTAGGISEGDIRRILVDNPARLLAVVSPTPNVATGTTAVGPTETPSVSTETPSVSTETSSASTETSSASAGAESVPSASRGATAAPATN